MEKERKAARTGVRERRDYFGEALMRTPCLRVPASTGIFVHDAAGVRVVLVVRVFTYDVVYYAGTAFAGTGSAILKQ